jgi:hypothetical protein
LIKKAVDDGNHVHVPRIQIAPLGSILQQTNGEAGTGISAFIGDRLMQENPFTKGKVSIRSLLG